MGRAILGTPRAVIRLAKNFQYEELQVIAQATHEIVYVCVCVQPLLANKLTVSKAFLSWFRLEIASQLPYLQCLSIAWYAHVYNIRLPLTLLFLI